MFINAIKKLIFLIVIYIFKYNMFVICIPNITHDHINIISDEYNININKSNAICIDDYYIYKVDKNLTSGVLYQTKLNNENTILHTPNIYMDNYNYILMYSNIYDTGVAKVYHYSQDDIIMMIENKVIEFRL
jgi:hypothetical protein